jgi:hypothetical protein
MNTGISNVWCWNQCSGSGFIRSVDPDPDPEAQKLRTKIKKIEKFHVLNFEVLDVLF